MAALRRLPERVLKNRRPNVGARRAAADPLGIQVRSGLHTGEIEIAADEVRGIAVHIASRVAALAGPGEVLVSRTVKDLVAGSGLHFAERGRHALKGLQEPMDLYAVSN
jgi:class 3 adenylate cyclase